MEDQVQYGISLFTVWGMRLLGAVLIAIAAWVLGQFARKWIVGIAKLDPTLQNFLGGLARYSILAIGLIVILGQFGVQTASLIAVLGAAGLAIGLALQGTLSNVASGVMLLILRPFNVGDYISAGSVSGTVDTLGLFGTELITPDNIFIFVPNAQIWSGDIHNYSRHSQRRLDLPVSIAYEHDIDHAMTVLHDILAKEERLIHEGDKAPRIMVSQLGSYAVELNIRVWAKTDEFWDVKWDLTREIKKGLEAAGIHIPYPTKVEIHKQQDDAA